MGARAPRAVVLDTGALVDIERSGKRMLAVFEATAKVPVRFLVPAGVLAQAWRGGARQALLARFLARPEVEVLPLTEARARAAGMLCGVAGTEDVIDASVVLAAREHGAPVVSGDAGGLRALDPAVRVHEV
jgi:rRNA-processing protein FCF1